MEVKSSTCLMKTFNVTITSRNKTSIYYFFLFFNSVILCSLTALITYFQKKVDKKKLTVLTSPHVNKRAQEQFERKLFKKQLLINTTKTFKYLIFLKKLNYNVFSDISIKLKCIINNKDVQQLGLKTFSPNCCKFKQFYSFKVSFFYWKSRRKIYEKNTVFLRLFSLQKTIRLAKFLDLYGECLKSMFE